jgi:hypothetical protein
MGTVYKALDPQLDRIVALKRPRFDGPPDKVAERIQRFQREARAAAQVWHPHVCPIYDVGEHDCQPFVVMAYIEGQSIAQRLAEKGRFEDVGEAIRLICQVLEGLEAVHARGIIHRDVKPGNIIIDTGGRAILTDFGLARPEQSGEHLTSEGVILGTPAYMAPEQAAGQPENVGPWTDLYSTAIVAYQMLTGQLPGVGRLEEFACSGTKTSLPVSDRLSESFGGITPVFARALAIDPGQRFQTALQFRDSLEAWLASHRHPRRAPVAESGLQTGTRGETTSREDTESFPRTRIGRLTGTQSHRVIQILVLGLVLVTSGWVGGFDEYPPIRAALLVCGGALLFLGLFRIARHLERLDPKTRNRQGKTWLMKAAELGDIGAAKSLLFRGANVNARDIDGQNALMRAANRGYVDIVRVLLAHNANVDDLDYEGRTALDFARARGHREIVELLEKARARE